MFEIKHSTVMIFLLNSILFFQAESQIRAERDSDLKNLRRSISPKQPKSPASKSPRSRSTSPIPLKYSGYSQVATPYEEYRYFEKANLRFFNIYMGFVLEIFKLSKFKMPLSLQQA